MSEIWGMDALISGLPGNGGATVHGRLALVSDDISSSLSFPHSSISLTDIHGYVSAQSNNAINLLLDPTRPSGPVTRPQNWLFK